MYRRAPQSAITLGLVSTELRPVSNPSIVNPRSSDPESAMDQRSSGGNETEPRFHQPRPDFRDKPLKRPSSSKHSCKIGDSTSMRRLDMCPFRLAYSSELFCRESFAVQIEL